MSRIVIYTASIFMLFSFHLSWAQMDTGIVRTYMDKLTSHHFKGRGYVGNGMNKAADYIASEFKKMGLQKVQGSYFQQFEMPIVQYPKKMTLLINDKELEPGIDYLVDPFSNSWNIKNASVVHIDFVKEFQNISKINYSKQLKKIFEQLEKEQGVIVLHNVDSIKEWMGWKGVRAVSQNLPRGKYIIPQTAKPLWFPADTFNKAQILYVYGSVADEARNIQKISAQIKAKRVQNYKVKNVLGYVPATVPTDSFIVFTAHYDHIGMMGSKTMFAGASDNASGTAMMMNLARYYAANPQKYNVLFIACAAEEAGLLGSIHYAKYPLFPLANIRFLVNLDIWGDATGGLSVVNGKKFEKEYQYVLAGNKEIADGDADGFFKEIRQGEEAFNSDHAPFYAKGVPSFFFFTIGGPGHYHHVHDTSSTLQLTNINEAAQLMRIFVRKLQYGE